MLGYNQPRLHTHTHTRHIKQFLKTSKTTTYVKNMTVQFNKIGQLNKDYIRQLRIKADNLVLIELILFIAVRV